MSNYQASAADQYMLSVLVDEMTIEEADNALTGLSILTSMFCDMFPPERTFVRPDHQKSVEGAAGVRYIVYGDQGIEREMRLPRYDLASLEYITDTIERLIRISAKKAA